MSVGDDYLELPEATRADIGSDGWFATGDTAQWTSQGYVLLEWRTKDIVMRGDHNAPVEVLEALPKTPSGKVRKVELRERYAG